MAPPLSNTIITIEMIKTIERGSEAMYDLIHRGSGSRFRINNRSWSDALALARAFGWSPLGTLHADQPAWGGTYQSIDGQTVTDQDASNMAVALTKALDAIPTQERNPIVVMKMKDDSPISEEKRHHLIERSKGSLPPGLTPTIATAHEVREGVSMPTILIEGQSDWGWAEQVESDLPLPDQWSGEIGRMTIRDLIAFCLRGSFDIE